MKGSVTRWARVLIGPLLLAASLTGCSNDKASVDSLTAPIASPSPTPTPTIDPRVTDLERVKEGIEAPDFSLTDQNGATVRLSDFRSRKNVVLVFYRGFF